MIKRAETRHERKLRRKWDDAERRAVGYYNEIANLEARIRQLEAGARAATRGMQERDDRHAEIVTKQRDELIALRQLSTARREEALRYQTIAESALSAFRAIKASTSEPGVVQLLIEALSTRMAAAAREADRALGIVRPDQKAGADGSSGFAGSVSEAWDQLGKAIAQASRRP